MTTPRVWLVTGASSGLGRSLTEFVLAKGDNVVATLRKPEVLQGLLERYSKDRLLVLKVDVTNQAEIDLAFARTKEVFGRLDVVFNNAGCGMVGVASTTPIDAARALFEVNFWGAVVVSRAAVKFFREVNQPGRGGMLLQNSSITAVLSLPGIDTPDTSKHALDGFSEALAMEIAPQWNIKICILQPAGFKTNIVGDVTVFQDLVYKDRIAPQINPNDPGCIQPGDPAKFAKAVYLLVEDGNMPLHLPIGQIALEIAQKKAESLKKEISEATPWSADLLRDDIIQ